MTGQYQCSILTLNDLERLSCALSGVLKAGDVVFLQGPLGVGKSSLTRFLLQQMGYKGVVLSPTYGLVHSYDCVSPAVHHFDLYRLHDLDELVAIGAQDFFSSDSICVIEWPDLLVEWGVEPSWVFHLSFNRSDGSRQCIIESSSLAITTIQQSMVNHNEA